MYPIFPEGIVLGDGGFGSELRQRGVNVPSHVDSVWSALALKTDPITVEKIHLDYIAAGADYITINNYALTQPILSREGMSNELEDLILTAINLAKNAVQKSGQSVKIAASLPPLETSYRADLILPEKKMDNMYDQLVQILKDRVDLLICETMASGREARSALNSALKSNLPVWVSWTLHGNRVNRLPSGETIQQAYRFLDGLSADAYLVNCCGANIVTSAIQVLRNLTDQPIGGYANAENVVSIHEGEEMITEAERNHWTSVEFLSPRQYVVEVKKWIVNGANIVGGCCRIRPSYINLLRQLLDDNRT